MKKILICLSLLAATIHFTSCNSEAGDEVDPKTASLPSSVNMVNIGGGTFTMGGTTTQNDAPEVSVTLNSFSISATEITNAQYREFLNAAMKDGWLNVEKQKTMDPCGSSTEWVVIGQNDAPNAGQIFLQLAETGGCTSKGEPEHIDNKSMLKYNEASNTFEFVDGSKADYPINWVKWYGAKAFAEYYGAKLPSEAQWEYAARGGQQYQYPTDDGTLSSAKANYNGDNPGVYDPNGHCSKTAAYPANPYGLYDMGGNVWEWCEDYYSASFYKSGTTDPLNSTPGTESKRVRRGGSWNYHSATLQCHARAADLMGRGNNHFGFRIVK